MKKRNRRTENISVNFVNRQAEGWAFGVADAFRMNLDIKLDQRIDKEGNKAKEAKLGRKLEPSEKLTRRVWTQGSPPAYSFGQGHYFHEPPVCHLMAWDQALALLRRSIMVLRAKPDAGALVEAQVPDAEMEGDETTLVVESEAEDIGGGWVDYEVLTYEAGKLVNREQFSSSQTAFSETLRTGQAPRPAASVPKAESAHTEPVDEPMPAV